jgi:hypothetical protein
MKFDITNIIIRHTRKSGFNYEIIGVVNGQNVLAYTNDSEAFDYLKYNDDSEDYKQALLHCETKLMEAYIDGGN